MNIFLNFAENIYESVKAFNIFYRVGIIMAKDSQIDNKKKRMEKCNYQTPLTRENQNQNKNAKKKSIKNNDV